MKKIESSSQNKLVSRMLVYSV